MTWADSQPQDVPQAQAIFRKALSFVDRFALVISLILFLVFWESLIKLAHINPILLPSPGSVGLELIEVSRKGLLWGPLADSLKALGVGLAISLILGIPLGILIGASHLLDLLSTPYMWALRATPRIAIAPLVLIWVGFGYPGKIWMIVITAGIYVLLITQEGVKMVDETLVRVARSFGASRLDILIKVVLPYILPNIANAIRNGIGMGIVGLMIMEMFSAGGGIGGQVARASYTYDGARLYAFILVLTIVSLSLISISRRLESYLSRWREEAYV